MESVTKQRLIGAIVLIALAVIFLPLLVKGPAPDSGVSDVSMKVPNAPAGQFVEIPLNAVGEVPVGGVVGLKPSFGLVPQWPSGALGHIACPGPLTRGVRDAALMLATLARFDLRDPWCLPDAPRDWLGAIEDGAAGILLETTRDNAPARALYRAAGWDEDETQWYSRSLR